MEFQKSGPDDAEELSSYLHPIWHEVFDPIMIDGARTAEYIFSKWMNPDAVRQDMADGYEYGFVNDGGKRLGLYSWHFLDDGRFYINKLYLEPQFRGKGLGHRALLNMFDLARSKGCSEAFLNVYYWNERAVRAYERAGMHIRYRCLQPIGDGVTRNDLIMAIELRKWKRCLYRPPPRRWRRKAGTVWISSLSQAIPISIHPTTVRR